MPLGNEVDQATITSTINQMTAADAECDAAQTSVEATASYLTANWTGGASTIFRNAIAEWQDGLNNVKLGLRNLNDAMTNHYHTSMNLEDDNTQLATWT
jgi:uncharacterized protein YukE